MCDVGSIIYAAVAVIGMYASDRAQAVSASRQATALRKQNQVIADQIADQKGQEIDERARAARRERAAARVAASESGINLGSNSFLAMLQTSEITESINAGLILHNEKNAQDARQAQFGSNMAGIMSKNNLGMAVDMAGAGLQAYSASGGKMYLGKRAGPG